MHAAVSIGAAGLLGRSGRRAVTTRRTSRMFPGVWNHGDFAELHTAGRRRHLRPFRCGPESRWHSHRHRRDLRCGGIPARESSEAVAVGQAWDNDVRIVLFVKLAAACHIWTRCCGKGSGKPSAGTPPCDTYRRRFSPWRKCPGPAPARFPNSVSGKPSTDAHLQTSIRWPTRNASPCIATLPSWLTEPDAVPAMAPCHWQDRKTPLPWPAPSARSSSSLRGFQTGRRAPARCEWPWSPW